MADDPGGLTQDDLDLIEVHAAAAKAQADADAKQAEINAAAGVTNEETGQGSLYQRSGLKEGVRATGEGAVGLLDLPSRLKTSAENAQTRMTNAGVHMDGEQYVTDETPPAAQIPLREPSTPFAGGYNTLLPPDPEHPTARKVGNIFGASAPLIVAPELLAGGFSAAPNALANAGALSGTTYFGGQAGRTIDENLGGTGDKGEAVGSLIGGGVTAAAPLLTRNLVAVAGNKAFTAADSAARLAEADAAGVTPDLSLVGNNRAIAWGSRGQKAADLRNAQQQQIDSGIRDVARDVRGSPAAGPITVGTIGDQTSTAAAEAARRAAADADRIYDPLSKAAGRDTPLDDSMVQAELARLRTDKGVSSATEPTVDYFENLRNRDLARSPQGVTWGQQQAARAIDRPTDNTLSFEANARNDLRAAQTEALRQRAAQVGYSPQEFDAINEQYGGLRDERDILDAIAKKKDVGAYNDIFSRSNEQGGQNLDLLLQHGEPSAISRLLADHLELEGRGAVPAARGELPRDVGLRPAAPDFWDTLKPAVQQAYVPDAAARARMDAIMNTIRGDARRGGGQVEPPDPTAALSVATALGSGNPWAILGAGQKAASLLTRPLLRNENFTRAAVQGYSPTSPRDLARTLAAAVAGSQQQRARP